MPKPLYLWRITIYHHTVYVYARSPSGAFSEACRRLIRLGRISNRPPPDGEGWYRNTSQPSIQQAN